MHAELTRDDIRELLIEVCTRLEQAGIQATIRLVGGASMALSGRDRRVTVDIDASYSPALAVEKIVKDIAEERGLPRNWMNSSASAFIPSGAGRQPITLGSGYRIDLATPRTLLAMKLSSARQRDMEDLGYLVAQLDITDPDEAVGIAEEHDGDDDVANPPIARQDAEIVAAQAIQLARGKNL